MGTYKNLEVRQEAVKSRLKVGNSEPDPNRRAGHGRTIQNTNVNDVALTQEAMRTRNPQRNRNVRGDALQGSNQDNNLRLRVKGEHPDIKLNKSNRSTGKDDMPTVKKAVKRKSYIL
jgi:hypothetical protein